MISEVDLLLEADETNIIIKIFSIEVFVHKHFLYIEVPGKIGWLEDIMLP
jgi:hypothetical protein